MVYLDAAATTEPKQEVINAMMPYLTEKWHNPSSLYNGGVDVRKDIELARKTIANFINAEPEEIYFTSGASESNSWVLQGFSNNRTTYKPQIITTKIEHKSIINAINSGVLNSDVYYCNNDKYGMVDYGSLIKLLQICQNKSILASIQFANNEIGVIQDIKKISTLIHEYGGILHTDATQAFGKILIDVKEMGIDMVSASGHKIGCPKGIGFLYIKNGINIQPLIYGAQERGFRGGTENVAGIIGLAKAVELCNIDNNVNKKLEGLRNYFIDVLEDKFGCKLNGHRENRLSNNINVTFPQSITGESLLYTLDLSGVQISTGSACNSKSIEPSYVLKAIGLTDEEAMKTVRFSLFDDITYKDIDYVIDEINKTIKIINV